MATENYAGGLSPKDIDHQKDLQRLQELRPIDDDLMRGLFWEKQN